MTFDLPEPPSLNEIIDLAKRGKHGVMYRKAKNEYQDRAVIAMRNQHPRPPEPWQTWAITRQHYRLWNERDLPELSVGLKWAVDALAHAGYVEDDSVRHLTAVALPTQEIERSNRGLTLEIERT